MEKKKLTKEQLKNLKAEKLKKVIDNKIIRK